MPTLSERTIPYEVLIRFGADGKIQGMHSATRTLVLRGDQVISDAPNAPVTVTAGLHAGIPLGDVLAELQVSLVQTVEALTAERDQALQAGAAARTALAAEQAARSSAEEKAAAALGELAKLRQVLQPE